jgi:dihydroorotate dehydrogenase electron transfer subunit
VPITLHSRLPRTTKILEVVQETANVRTITLEGTLGALPGQFAMVWLPGVDEVPMSIAFDDGTTVAITFFAVGDFTQTLAGKKVGDLVGLRGPFGTHFTWEKGQHLGLLAGGYGAAPMYFLACRAIEDGCTIDAVVGARSREHLLYLEKLRSLRGCTVHVATDDGSQGFHGTNVALLEKLVAENPGSIGQVLACGPERMLAACRDLLRTRGIPGQLSVERYMKCGYGLCGNCVVDPLGVRLCCEGPVVSLETATAIAELGHYHRDALGKKHAV